LGFKGFSFTYHVSLVSHVALRRGQEMFCNSAQRNSGIATILSISIVLLPCLLLLPRAVSARATVHVPSQAKPYRQPEVLIRFKEGTSESDKENAATLPHRRRMAVVMLSGADMSGAASWCK
jgi:hypothetical protein